MGCASSSQKGSVSPSTNVGGTNGTVSGWQSMLEMLSQDDSIYVAIGVDGRYLYVSPSIGMFVQYSSTSLLGLDHASCIHPLDQPGWQAALESGKRRSSGTVAVAYRRRKKLSSGDEPSLGSDDCVPMKFTGHIVSRLGSPSAIVGWETAVVRAAGGAGSVDGGGSVGSFGALDGAGPQAATTAARAGNAVADGLLQSSAAGGGGVVATTITGMDGVGTANAPRARQAQVPRLGNAGGLSPLRKNPSEHSPTGAGGATSPPGADMLPTARMPVSGGAGAAANLMSFADIELKNALHALDASAAAIADSGAGASGGDNGRDLSDILFATRNARVLVNDLMSLARISEGTFTASPEAVNVRQVLLSVATDMRPPAAALGLPLALHVAPDVPRMAVLDADILAKILRHAVVLAMKYPSKAKDGPSPGIAVAVSKLPGGDRLLCEVLDAGAGLAGHKTQELLQALQEEKPMKGSARALRLALVLPLAQSMLDAVAGTVGVEERALGSGEVQPVGVRGGTRSRNAAATAAHVMRFFVELPYTISAACVAGEGDDEGADMSAYALPHVPPAPLSAGCEGLGFLPAPLARLAAAPQSGGGNHPHPLLGSVGNRSATSEGGVVGGTGAGGGRGDASHASRSASPGLGLSSPFVAAGGKENMHPRSGSSSSSAAPGLMLQTEDTSRTSGAALDFPSMADYPFTPGVEMLAISATGANRFAQPTGPSTVRGSDQGSSASGSTPGNPSSSGGAGLVGPSGRRVVGLDGQMLNMHVMLVDDVRPIRRQGENFLEQLGCSCVALEDGDQVDGALSAASRPFDAILLDIHMHRTDGTQVCQQLREQNGVRCPIIAMTGAASSKDKERYYTMGFDVVLPKPFTRESMGRALVEARERRGGGSRFLRQGARGVASVLFTGRDGQAVGDLGRVAEEDGRGHSSGSGAR